MINQALFSSKGKSKKLKCRLLQFLFGALRLVTAYVPKANGIWSEMRKRHVGLSVRGLHLPKHILTYIWDIKYCLRLV